MKGTIKHNYQSPCITVYELQVECGFAQSGDVTADSQFDDAGDGWAQPE